MAKLMRLRDAVAAFVRDGDVVALEGDPQLVPFAAAHELIRQARRDLTIIRVAPDLILDQLVGMGCAGRLIVGWGSSPGRGRLHRVRDAVAAGGQQGLRMEQLRRADLIAAYAAGAANLPFGLLRGYAGATGGARTARIRTLRSPFDDQEVAAIRPVRPDVAFIHAQEADRSGNVLLWGALGVQRQAALASRRVVVTVEEIGEDLTAWPNAVRLPRSAVAAVCAVPGGAHPSPVLGHYERDHAFYRRWDGIAREPATFLDWMERHVLGTPDFEAFRRTLASTERCVRQR